VPSEPEPAAPDRRTLAWWVRALIDTLDERDPLAGGRMRQVTGAQRAVVGLDDERVEVWFGPTGIEVADPPTGGPVDGVGITDRATVRGLLAGRLEASRVILDGQIDLHGSPDACSAVLHAIEILLDAASREPALQRLADELMAEDGITAPSYAGGTAWYPSARPASEEALLGELGLLDR